MCRLLSIVSSEPSDFKIVLREAPRSMAALSREHRDGWGLAVFDDARGWYVERGVVCANEDARFHELAAGSRGEVLISHVRQKTVGDTSITNTHPFERCGWVFAHNGTVNHIEWLRTNSSPRRLGEICGDTDSEVLFAWLLTQIDEAGSGGPDGDIVERALASAVRVARERPGFGVFNFLLSNGMTTYAHRFGRTMYLLERGPENAVRTQRMSSDGMTTVETAWSPHRVAVFIASEQITDEPWQGLEEGMLVRVDREPAPHWRLVAA
jgi:predicted glutamine amidotransferase